MKIAIYSPYLDTFGGGEKYMMTIAQVLSSDSSVEVFLDQHLKDIGGDYLKSELSKRFNLNLTKVNFISAPIGKDSSFFSRSFFLKNYDLLFYLTDGSIFFPTSEKNILHIQSPLVGQPANSIWGKLKLKSWNLIIYNSKFTENYSKKNWPLSAQVIYPPVDVDKIKPLKKKKYILSVGRFFGYLKDKKHEVLIRVFKELFEKRSVKEWSLHLAGSAGKGDQEYFEQLQNLAKGVPIKFYPNLAYNDLVELYGESSIYWHASGYGETDPTKMEHFGISTVEAMSGGCVPVAIGKGGQLEIIEDKISGYFWDTLVDLKELTLKLINEGHLRKQMSRNATDRSKSYSKNKFEESILRLVQLLNNTKV